MHSLDNEAQRSAAAGERDGAFDPSILSPFRSRFPWWGGDLQTLRNHLMRQTVDLSPWPGQRLELPLADGSGDRLWAVIHGRAWLGERPLVILVHGLTGCEDSHYICRSAAHFLGLGYPVLRLNLRGAGPSRPHCRAQYHAGRSADLRDAIRSLIEQHPAAGRAGVLPVGFSLGGNMLVKLLAEVGRELPVRAAAAVSVPIDLKAAQERLMARRNSLYHGYLLRRMAAEFLAGPAVTARQREAVGQAASVYDYDQTIVAPLNGFAGADDYYARCSAREFLAGVEVPTLVIQAADDPWIPASSYRAVDWARLKSNVTVSMSPGGGHVGFHGTGSRVAWHDRAIAAFFQKIGAGPAQAAMAMRTEAPAAG